MSDSVTNVSNLSAEDRRQLLKRLLQEREAVGEVAFPLSAGQRGFWFLHCLSPNSSVCNIGSALRFAPALDLLSFEFALQALVKTHPTLRTVFRATDGLPIQLVLPDSQIPIRRIAAARKSDEELERELRAAFRRPFDLATGPLMRVDIFEREHEQLILLVLHHVICDGWSFGILIEELRAYYEQAFANAPIQPRQPRAGYRDFVISQMKYLAGKDSEEAQKFWRDYLPVNPEPLSLPYDFERSSTQSLCGATVPMMFDASLTGPLRSLARTESTTLYVVLLTAYGLLLRELSGATEVLVGMPASGRDDGPVEDLIGCFINAVPVRLRLPPEWGFREALQHTKHQALAALRYSRLPFSRIVDLVHPRRDPSRHPVYQTTFNMFHPTAESNQQDINGLLAGRSIRFGESELVGHEMSAQEGMFELSVDLIDSGERVAGQFSYDPALFRRETVEGFADAYLKLLHSLAEDSGTIVITL